MRVTGRDAKIVQIKWGGGQNYILGFFYLIFLARIMELFPKFTGPNEGNVKGVLN